ncbi:MAG TPA: YdeI/OmpD-associated family protein [Thermoanaerobaculia bacterium]|nr:YdeI/OmpD-associated family protein [Thermoanaerobaculia bacterium]
MPEPTNVAFFPTAEDFRRWLEEHHATAKDLWVGYHKKGSGPPSVTYPQSVDEALAFGWIDGVRKSLGPTTYANRFTPRKPGSTWSAVNVRRVGELTAEGRMHPAGLAAFAARDPAKTELYSYERETAALDPEAERRFRDDPAAWEHFQAQPPSYRRTITWWVVSAKKEETRRRRLDKLIAASAAGRRLL